MVLYAKDILEPEFISMRPQTSLLEAAKLMADRHHGFVIVTSPEGRPIGIVTEWDILAKVVAVARKPPRGPPGGSTRRSPPCGGARARGARAGERTRRTR